MPYRKYIKTTKNGGFCQELLRENDFEAVVINFCCHEYGANVSEAVQEISTSTQLELCQLTNTASFKATPVKKNI